MTYIPIGQMATTAIRRILKTCHRLIRPVCSVRAHGFVSITKADTARDVSVALIKPADLPAVIGMLNEFAKHEEVCDPIKSTVETLYAAMFGDKPSLFGYLARHGEEPVGLILGYETYSTFEAKPRLFIEDLFVRANCRGAGVGRALIGAFACRCITQNCNTMHWRVQARNAPGVRLYRSIDAVISADQLDCTLEGAPLHALADGRFWSAMPGGALPGPVDVRRAR
jgi:GNAT superfamily N-acetyltransferase